MGYKHIVRSVKLGFFKASPRVNFTPYALHVWIFLIMVVS